MGTFTTKPFSEMTDDELQGLVKDAHAVLRASYYREIRGLADDLLDELKRGALEVDGEAVDRWIHETLDGHQRVIYTYEAQMVAIISDHDNAYADNYGADGLVQDGAINWAGIAYAAMREDLLEELDSRGFDPNDPQTWLDELQAEGTTTDEEDNHA
jgi:hypothetical protein